MRFEHRSAKWLTATSLSSGRLQACVKMRGQPLTSLIFRYAEALCNAPRIVDVSSRPLAYAERQIDPP